MRIVSLLPSGTELVAALGLADALVGISHECDYPPDILGRPRLTSSILEAGASPSEIDAAVADASLQGRPLYVVDGARLAALEPDLIVTQGVCAVCAVTPATIDEGLRLSSVEAACVAPVLSLEGTDLDCIFADLLRLGEATGRTSQARTLVDQLRSRWRAVAALPRLTPPPRLAMLEWPDPPWSAGHWVPEQVAVAGGVDLFGRAGEVSRRLEPRAILDVDPDWILGIACGFGLDENARHLRELIARPGWRDLSAVRAGRVVALDANSLFSRPGPRVVDGAEVLARLLRGERVDAALARNVVGEGA